MKPEAPNQVRVTLPDGIIHLTEVGDHDILIADDGRLTIMEYTEPRNTNGVVAAFTAGHWLTAFICRSKA